MKKKAKRSKSRFRIRHLLLISLLLFLVYAFYQHQWIENNLYPIKYEEIITEQANLYDLDPYLISAVIWAESRYKETAVSRSGAIGLMQLMPETGQWVAGKMKIKDFKEEDLFDPETNIKLGTWLLNWLYQKYDGNVELTLSAYNAGAARVQGWLDDGIITEENVENIPYAETRSYVTIVLQAREHYVRLYILG